jgi:hypothetical protein
MREHIRGTSALSRFGLEQGNPVRVLLMIRLPDLRDGLGDGGKLGARTEVRHGQNLAERARPIREPFVRHKRRAVDARQHCGNVGVEFR